MNNNTLSFQGAALHAMGSGALWWPEQRLLCVSDLHLGKSERMARRGGSILPPYETVDTLTRLEADIDRTDPQTVICLGDSFDDTRAAVDLPQDATLWITRLQAGRTWIWIEGNHDPGPTHLGGAHLGQYHAGDLVFRHIAQTGSTGEISGHYHPKATVHMRGRSVTRPAFLADRDRIIMPAYGTYTGGLHSGSEVLRSLMQPDTLAILTGPAPVAVPMPR